MPQIDFAEAFAEESAQLTPPSTSAPLTESCRTDQAPIFIEPSRYRTTRLGRSEWANILFAGITIAGGLFCAFYFFNGAELVRTALAWPGEYLYPRPALPGEHIAMAAGSLPDEAPLPGTLPARRSSKTDPSGDPFPKTNRLLTLDRPIGSFPRGSGGGLTAGTPPLPVLPPPISGSPFPPGVPGLPGGSVGGLPGPGTLISRLTLLLPGGDALTQILQRPVASVSGNFIVTVRHDMPRIRTLQRRIVRRILVRPSSATAGGRRAVKDRTGRAAQIASGAAPVQPGISSGIGTGESAQDRMNAGTGAISVGMSAVGLGGGVGGGIGGTIGGVSGGLRGTVGGALGGVGGAVGGLGGGGLLGGGRH